MAGKGLIKILRGTTAGIKRHEDEVLGAGQPLYNTETRQLYVGNGNSAIKDTLPIVGIPVSPTLEDNSWATIKEVSNAGIGANYWALGDTKAVTFLENAFAYFGDTSEFDALDAVAKSALSGTYDAYIIGFDHNAKEEGQNTITFQFGRNADGKEIAFTDTTYGSEISSTGGFGMNKTASNAGGWASSYMRTVVIPYFQAKLPLDLQAALKPVTKWSDNVGDGTNTADNVTETTDRIFLLAEYEVFGERSYANSAEQTKQAQYDYYKTIANSNTKRVRYRSSADTSTSVWWLRSAYYGDAYNFCIVGTSGRAVSSGADYSRGFAPAFVV